MCSQPPKTVDDDWLLEEAFELVRLLPRTTRDISFTGGEPTLYGERLHRTAAALRTLTARGGRSYPLKRAAFRRSRLREALGSRRQPKHDGRHPDLRHRTVAPRLRRAIQRCVRRHRPRNPQPGSLKQRIEIRVVVHKQTAPYLVEIAEFISRNLPFVEQVALMGLEMIGLARANIDTSGSTRSTTNNALTEAVRATRSPRHPAR